MADCSPDQNHVGPATKDFRPHAGRPRYLLDELVARKLSVLTPGRMRAGGPFADDPPARREPLGRPPGHRADGD